MMSVAIRSARLLAQTRACSTVPDWQAALEKPAAVSTLTLLKNQSGGFVDKTLHLRPLVTERLGKMHIAAPRRFGKTSTMHMVADLYRRNAKTLFNGTDIEKKGFFDGWEPHPFVIFDFSECYSPSILEDKVRIQIAKWAALYRVVVAPNNININIEMTDLLDGIYNITKMPVVVLIDEYDIPTRSLDPACKRMLNEFYGAIKSCTVLRQMIMFGTFNTFRGIGTCTNDTTDLSENTETLGLFGFTQDEVNSLFESKVEKANYYCRFATTVPGVNEGNTVEANRKLVLDQLKLYYNGFRLAKLGPSFYSPFSVMQARLQAEITAYFATTEILSEMQGLALRYPTLWKGKPGIQMDGNVASIDGKELNADKSQVIKGLWNLGLLTLDKYVHPVYHLMVPNEEVRGALRRIVNEKLIATYGNEEAFGRVCVYAAAGDFAAMATALKEALPQHHARFLGSEVDLKYALKLGLRKSGGTVDAEVQGVDNKKYDLRLKAGNKIFVFELKYDQGSAEGAMEQIKNKKYCQKELKDNQLSEVYAVGLAYPTSKPTEVIIKRATLKTAASGKEEVDLEAVVPPK